MIFISNFNKRFKSKFHKIFLERFEYIYKDLPDQIVKINNRKQIPNVIYQTWVNRSVPWRMSKGIENFRNLNKDYSFILFTHQKRDEYMKNKWGKRKIYDIYKNSVFQCSKADIWRYCILYEKGGYYFDIKAGCEIPIRNIKISNGASLSLELNNAFIPPSLEVLKNCKKFDLNIICNWAFGFKKNHPLLKIQIDNIEKYSDFFKGKTFQNPKSKILSFTGPGMLSKSYREYIKIFKKEISMNGVDFFGKGVYQLKGSQYRFKMSLDYGKVKSSKILK